VVLLECVRLMHHSQKLATENRTFRFLASRCFRLALRAWARVWQCCYLLWVCHFTGLIPSISIYTKISPNAGGRNPDGEKRKIRIPVVTSLLGCTSSASSPRTPGHSKSPTQVTLYFTRNGALAFRGRSYRLEATSMASGDDLAQTLLEPAQNSGCKVFPELGGSALQYVFNGEVYFKAAVWEKYGSIIILLRNKGIVEIGGPRCWTTLI
jgi:hypothetical protein